MNTSVIANEFGLNTAFGIEAGRIARRCENGLPLLWCDGSHVAEALAEAVRRRREGEQYLVMPLFQDSLSIVSREAARSIYLQFSNADTRRELFEALAAGVLQMNGATVNATPVYTPQIQNTLRELSQFGDGVLVRSVTERQRLENSLGRKRQHVAVTPFVDTTVPQVYPRAGASRIVVWAPNEDAVNLCTFAYALWYSKQQVIFVCRGQLPDSPHQFVEPESGAEALKDAAMVIDTQISDPGTAIAFAQLGYSLAASVHTGAHEYITGVATYQMHDFTSICAAASRARACASSLSVALPDPSVIIRKTIAAAQPMLPKLPPMASLVIPTYNRRAELRQCLEVLAKQHYPNFEVVVVNDCGEDVSDIVAEFSFARYMCTPENVGSIRAVNLGLRHSFGAFVGVVADDDRNYPAHIAMLAAALIHSGVDVAHGNIVLRLDTTLPDGTRATYGHLLEHDGDSDPWAVYWGMPIHAQGYLIRREAFEKIGFLNEALVCASDIDCSMRLSKYYDFVHVNAVTGEMSYRDDKTNLSSQVGDKLAPEIEGALLAQAPTDSPLIAARIAQCVRYVVHSSQQPTFFRPWVPLQNLLPLYRESSE